ncbi:calmodulin-binding receptor-like cytoplasmic kinase 2 isoform X4 [Miscanthus floridulus]|uniref:calmodulin-binding receptor-like cytoplasmic kinase 2 isoform X4 n=1 Tax=Miscanthus floridulus TaxID=154761 RepID=UPI003458C201
MASWPATSRRQSSSSSKSAELSGSSAHSHSRHGRAASSPGAYGYGRQLSSYSTRSSQVSSSVSFSTAAQRVAGAFTSCFVPRRQVTTEEEEEEEKSRRSGCHVSIDSAGSWQEGRALTIADVSKATSNFSEKNMIRQGRSSTMYRGKLKDGSQIAVKCVRKLNGQNLTAELWRELETLEKTEHRNLARLFGFFERTADSLVVVEYVSNGSLREHLDESCGNGLELAQRLNIAIDVAQGITYLHEYKGIMVSCRASGHPWRHPVVERAADRRTDGEGGRLWAGRDGGLGLGLRLRLGCNAGEGRCRVRGPGVPEHVPADRQERRVRLRRPPRRARHRPAAHRAQPRRRGPAHHQMGVAEVQGRGSRGGHGPQDAAEPGVGGRGGEDAGAGSAVRGDGQG